MSGERKTGVKWVRPPEFADDLDVSKFYERLLEDAEVKLTHEYRTARGEIGGPEDLNWVQKHSDALARRAAEDGLKVRWDYERSIWPLGERRDDHLRQTRKHNYWRDGGVLVLDGPLTAEIADAAAPYREWAKELFDTLREKGEVDVKYSYTHNALLKHGSNAVISSELERLAGEAGIKLHWDYEPADDIGVWVYVVPDEESDVGR